MRCFNMAQRRVWSSALLSLLSMNSHHACYPFLAMCRTRLSAPVSLLYTCRLMHTTAARCNSHGQDNNTSEALHNGAIDCTYPHAHPHTSSKDSGNNNYYSNNNTPLTRGRPFDTTPSASSVNGNSCANHMGTPAGTPGGVDYSARLRAEAEALERRRQYTTRASDAERAGRDSVAQQRQTHELTRHRYNAQNIQNNNNKSSSNKSTEECVNIKATHSCIPDIELQHKQEQPKEEEEEEEEEGVHAQSQQMHAVNSNKPDEMQRWWPDEDPKWSGNMFPNIFDTRKRRVDGMYVPPLTHTPHPSRPDTISYQEDNFFAHADWHMMDETPASTRRLPPPARFDPAIDDVDDEGFTDRTVMLEIQQAVEEDKRRLEAFGNPMLMEDQVDRLLEPQRAGQDEARQREAFNGFAHWGLLHGAHMILEENHDVKRAHELVNRSLRDVDLFEHWLEHPLVRAHLQRKFRIDMHARFDKRMAVTMALYTRSKVQVYEDDAAGALKSLTACVALIAADGAKPEHKKRHEKALGAVLVARGMVYVKLRSYTCAEEDLTRALAFVPAHRSPTLFQLRAEAREGLGRLEEARADEERAAEMWERAEVVEPGMSGTRHKFVI